MRAVRGKIVQSCHQALKRVAQANLWLLVVFLACLLLAAPGSQAAVPQRTQEVRGKVVDSKGSPIGGVVCTLTGGMLPSAGLTVTTGPKGDFGIRGLLPGSYDLACTALGYRPVVETGIKIVEGEAPRIHVEMPAQKVLVQKVEVHAEGGTVSQQHSSTPSKLSSKEIATLPIAEQNFKAALPLVPGVIRTPTGKINIKGTVENVGMLLVDGAQAVNPITGGYDIDLSIDAIQSLNIYKAPFEAQYGGFSGGLTTIDTKAPASDWGWDLNDFFPGFRGRGGHLVGVNDWEPRLDFTGPLWKDHLNFSEAFIYDLVKIPIRGLAWPHNETKKEGYNSFTTFQYIASPRHIVSFNFHLFPRKQEFANISALVPQPASSNYSERGFSLQGNDNYQFSSGGILTSLFKYTKFDANAHGQGPESMLITPNGYGGDYFNTWRRASNQEEGSISYRLPRWNLLGKHSTNIGGDLIYRSYSGTSQSHPVLVTRLDGTIAQRIDYLGPGGVSTSQDPVALSTSNAEGAAFAGDHWAVRDNAALDIGFRYYGQAVGQAATFAPRLGFVYSPGHSGRSILRAGAGIFKSRVPLLASDFESNPTQVVTLFDSAGNPTGPSVTYQNRCATRTSTGFQMLPDCSDLDATPYNLTWQVEFDHQLTGQIALKLSYLRSSTYRDFVINPELSSTEAMLLLSNRGVTRYHEFEALISYRNHKGDELNTSYVRSRSRGDLNIVSNVFVPFQEPIIRPSAYSSLNADVPDRFISWGIFHLPFKIVFAPIVDVHTGFPWSKINDLQQYVGEPNSNRFPLFFSFDFKVWKMLPLPGFLPFGLGHSKLRWGIGFHNATNNMNPLAVYNNIASPYFGHFVGFQHRVIDINVDTGP